MDNYPTLSQNPDADSFEQAAANDPTIRSNAENGMILTRARFTRVPEKYKYHYTALSNADKETLKAFEVSMNYGSDSFVWTNPVTNVTHTVRFSEPVKYVLNNSLNNDWNVSVSITEV